MQELTAAATSQGSTEQLQQPCSTSRIGASPASARDSWPVLCSRRRFSCVEACDASSTSGSSFTCSCTHRRLTSRCREYTEAIRACPFETGTASPFSLASSSARAETQSQVQYRQEYLFYINRGQREAQTRPWPTLCQACAGMLTCFTLSGLSHPELCPWCMPSPPSGPSAVLFEHQHSSACQAKGGLSPIRLS